MNRLGRMHSEASRLVRAGGNDSATLALLWIGSYNYWFRAELRPIALLNGRVEGIHVYMEYCPVRHLGSFLLHWSGRLDTPCVLPSYRGRVQLETLLSVTRTDEPYFGQGSALEWSL